MSNPSAIPRRENFKVLLFLIASMLFFVTTLLISFFLIILWINKAGVSPDYGPNLFMLGLVPPSVATLFLYVKVFGRFLWHSERHQNTMSTN